MNFTAAATAGLESMLRANAEEVVRTLAAKYSFDADEAIASLVLQMSAPQISVPAPKTEKKAVAKRGRSAYSFYMKDATVREELKAAHPDWGFGDISKAIAENWKQMPLADRQKYIDQSDAEKAALQVEGPIRLDEPPKKVKKPKSAATSSDEEGVVSKPKKQKTKKAVQVLANSSDDLIASLVANANAAGPAPAPAAAPAALQAPAAPAPAAAPAAMTLKVNDLSASSSPDSAMSASMDVVAAPQLSESDEAAKAEKKRKALEKRRATAAAKKAKQTEEALASQMANMTIQSELAPEQVASPAAPKAAVPVAAPKAPVPATKITLAGVSYYNQEGWLYDKAERKCVGFWNGTSIEPIDDESDDDE